MSNHIVAIPRGKKIIRKDIKDENTMYEKNEKYLNYVIDKLIKRANELITEHNNYDVRYLELHIGYGQPVKLKIWVGNIQDREAFHDLDNGQCNIYEITTVPDFGTYQMKHLIDIEEF